MSQQKIKAIRGMHDITPEKSGNWSRIEAAIEGVFASYAYREIRMPIVESTGLFQRSIGEVTDIVEKEMYTFADRNGETITLRPEGTAGCVRACIENSLLDVPQKLWYGGPMFRYERPQKGRQRQFHQMGAEVFGYSSVEVEVEMLLLISRFWQVLGLQDNIQLQLNNIGSNTDRAQYQQALVDYLTSHRESIDSESQRRLETNPLRILDSKDPQTQSILESAPRLSAFLSEESQTRLAQLIALLEASGVKAEVNERLVRGLDYYNDTVFEWVSEDLGAQATVCGGGRYDGLVEQLGGKSTPAIGFALGLERLYLLLEAQQFASLDGNDKPDIYLIVSDSDYQAKAFQLAESLRSRMPNFVIMQQLTTGRIKNQFKKADKSGARYALILGEDEVANGQLTVKNLADGQQQCFDIADSIDQLLVYLKNTESIGK